MRFSANLGFLWTELSLPDAIHAAKAAGFDAVECHWPYDTPAEQVAQALRDTGLAMLGLNTRRGDAGAGDNGLAALPDREPQARAAIDEALAYARAINAANVHVMAGKATGAAARATFARNLAYACRAAAPDGITILIEPLNTYDAPGYFLSTAEQAIEIMDSVGAENLKLMFDCYHMQLMGGDLSHRLTRLLPRIGHIQIASVPDRGAPDHGEVHYPHIFDLLTSLGHDAPLGAEYKPSGPTGPTLGWLAPFRDARTPARR